MRTIIYLLLVLAFAACNDEKTTTISVSNPSDAARENEVAELDFGAFGDTFTKDNFVVIDPQGKEVPSQVTSDNKLLILVSVKAHEIVNYRIRKGERSAYPVMASGKQYPERVDDIAWENDRIAFRTYGPALQATGERAFGFDVWVKSVPDMVVADRYSQELNNGISYHEDHGNGLDYYSVGPTLGAGVSALLANDTIVYPYCYREYEILDNGPLRFTVKLTYNPLAVGTDTDVTETRCISLDAGSQLNKITVSYDGLSVETPIVTGIVMHEPSEEYSTDADEGYIAYADPADPKNGQTYLGAVFTEKPADARTVYFSDAEKADRKALGHVLAFSTYRPGQPYTYYTGAGWSKYGFKSSDDWFRYVRAFAQKKKQDFVVNVF